MLTPKSPVDHILYFCIHNRLVTLLMTGFFILAGIFFAPFDWKLPVERAPIAVDAIPDIGENQQILFTDWEGRSPQDVEDQITYPLTVSVMGLSGVKSVRSFSMFGFSSLYLIFDDSVSSSAARTRILERLSSFPEGLLPTGVKPQLGPDATGLGQVFWYTLEGRDPAGKPAKGWDLQELRSIQDWQVRYSLLGVSGVAEVAGVGGMVKEFLVEADPQKLASHGVTLMELYDAIRRANRDVGAQTLEINQVEYLIRGAGLVKSTVDIETALVKDRNGIPLTVADVARVTEGPAPRRGILDNGGTEAVGGVVVVRDGANPMAVISAVKKEIQRIEPTLPAKTLADGTESRVTIVPFYDRSGLISETLGTLNDAIYDEILITMLVVIFMVGQLGSSLLISSILPLAVLGSFIAMKFAGVDANIVSLSGIAIAIGTVVDMGIILSENYLRHRERPENIGRPSADIVYEASSEVGSAILAAIGTTLIGFMPIFFMEGAEGKLFIPLAFTKTFALIASVICALTVLPALLTMIGAKRAPLTVAVRILVLVGAAAITVKLSPMIGVILIVLALRRPVSQFIPEQIRVRLAKLTNPLILAVVTVLLARHWRPLGYGEPLLLNILFTALVTFSFLGFSAIFIRKYPAMLAWLLPRKRVIIIPVGFLTILGFSAWIGLPNILPHRIASLPVISPVVHLFPGFSKEFMPALDEGSFLFMPTAMTHGSIGAIHEVLAAQDKAIASIPEVSSVVGKLGRAESALDPAPAEMIETVINVKSEFLTDESGRVLRYAWDKKEGFLRDSAGNLIPKLTGKPFRQWRDSITSMDQIWEEITAKAAIPGVTSAPKLMPIAARIVMLQSGMRAPMGIKIYGKNLADIDKFSQDAALILQENPVIEPSAVLTERIVGKPYLDIVLDRPALARYGLAVEDVQGVIETAVGGMNATTVIDGRERYSVKVRYPRELRGVGDLTTLENLPVVTMGGRLVPLGSVAKISYRRGPQMLKSENGLLVSYLLFDKKGKASEVDAAMAAKRQIESALEQKTLALPEGVSWKLVGNWENQQRAQNRLMVLLPVALFMIFLVLYFQFKKISSTMMVFSTIFMAWAGGFFLLWCYNQPWFLNIPFGTETLREILNIRPVNLSVAIWVGFLALFGIASDDGVLVTTYMDQLMDEQKPTDRQSLHETIVTAATRRVRPAQMTSMTTILALIPLLTATGRGSDIMGPMAIPVLGGMFMELLTILTVPVFYSFLKERELK